MFNIKKMVTASLLIALGIVLPMTLHAIPNAGRIFLPMHIPVLLSGLTCGIPYGLAVGVITPILSHLITGMPPTPMLPQMICELAAYGAVSAVLMRYIKLNNLYIKIYIALIGAMLFGRLFYGVLNSLIFNAGEYSMQMWLTAAFTMALPGIIVQIILIPAVIIALQKARWLKTAQIL